MEKNISSAIRAMSLEAINQSFEGLVEKVNENCSETDYIRYEANFILLMNFCSNTGGIADEEYRDIFKAVRILRFDSMSAYNAHWKNPKEN